MRARIISGVVATLLLVPSFAGADQHDVDVADDVCYLNPLADECVTDVLPQEPLEKPDEEPTHPDEPTVDREVEPTDVLSVSEEATLARTGIDTPVYVALAAGLLGAGALLLFGSRRRAHSRPE